MLTIVRIADIIGAKRVLEREFVGYQASEGGRLLTGKPFRGEASAGNGTQVGIPATTRAIVDAAQATEPEHGGTCERPPIIHGDDPDGFYAAHFRDLDGNKLMVFRHS
jgi:hypothetical protein